VLKWCAYCQQFTGESPKYDDFSITHGLCARCATRKLDLFSTGTVDHANFLRGIFDRLFGAGCRNDFEAAARIVDEAIAAHCRPVDILVGMIAPMLFQIGEDWKRGVITVEGEHRFTAFSEKVIDLVQSRMAAHAPALAPQPEAPLLFLMNAPGNRHTLAVRILALWLESRGINTRIVDEHADLDVLMHDVADARPGFLLISMALPEQRDHVAEVAAHIQALPAALRPRLLVGGYPVKVGLVQSIPGADLVTDISALSFA
jgi:methanogenic corrinoid protein MtbC1